LVRPSRPLFLHPFFSPVVRPSPSLFLLLLLCRRLRFFPFWWRSGGLWIAWWGRRSTATTRESALVQNRSFSRSRRSDLFLPVPICFAMQPPPCSQFTQFPPTVTFLLPIAATCRFPSLLWVHFPLPFRRRISRYAF